MRSTKSQTILLSGIVLVNRVYSNDGLWSQQHIGQDGGMHCHLNIAFSISLCVTGLADPSALTQAVAAYQGCHFIGMPECEVK